jgi:N-acetylglucosaminyldiphosphoundecaprenol N-acetyl-beta-D-mannosaminyltransferase
MKLLGFEIFDGDMSSVLSKKKEQCIINTINPHSYITSLSDPIFHKALSASDVLLPDGSGIVIASKILNKRSIDKFTGPEALNFALNYLNKAKSKVYFLGSSQKTLSAIESKINKKYRNINVRTYSPPFVDNFTDIENHEMINDIGDFNPDLVCIGMTAPKQEKWVYINRNELPNCHIMAIGAAFDWFSEMKTPPSAISHKLHLAWLERFFREPIRMIPRIKSMLHFLYIIMKKWIRKY